MRDPSGEIEDEYSYAIGKIVFQFPEYERYGVIQSRQCTVEGFEPVTLRVESPRAEMGMPVVGFNIGSYGNRSITSYDRGFSSRYQVVKFVPVGQVPDKYRGGRWPASPAGFAILQAASCEYLGYVRTKLGLKGIVHLTPYMNDPYRDDVLNTLGYELRFLRGDSYYIKGYGTR